MGRETYLLQRAAGPSGVSWSSTARETLDRGLAADPGERYASVGELMAGVEESLRPSWTRRVSALLGLTRQA